MSDTILQVDNLSKKYVISHQQEGHKYKTLRDLISFKIKSLNPNLFKPEKQRKFDPAHEEFWALKDVSFEIKQGDRVGIIGRNGSGKSTLLKILSRITEPTRGNVFIKGRVASLLEVGTGFHPELTGRENIYLNGVILGMSKAEIKRKFDEIVDFADVEKFLDTPVKRYSSGMYVRLAFAVAAHLEPEILIVDEVLAVGDAQFQKKCVGKMRSVASEGRTVIFVSHQMAAIANLCSSSVVLQNGMLLFYGNTEHGIKKYLESNIQQNDRDEKNLNLFRPSWAKPLISSIQIFDSVGREQRNFPLGSDIVIDMQFNTLGFTALKAPVMGVVINHSTFGAIGGVNTRMTGFEASNSQPYTSATMRCILKKLPLLQGDYTIDVWLGDGSINIDNLNSCLNICIEETDIYGTSHPPFSSLGAIFLNAEWKLIKH